MRLRIFIHLIFTLLFVSHSRVFAQERPKNQSLADKLKAQKEKGAAKTDAKTKKIMQKAHNEIAASDVGKNALRVGEKAPNVKFQSTSGGVVALKTLYKNNPVVLTFYRGAWCPYCRLELTQYNDELGDFRRAGVRLIAATPDTFTEIRRLQKKLNLGFVILKDGDNSAAMKFGLKFLVPDKLNKVYQSFGIDIKRSTGQSTPSLPIPGTYVIDQKGIVRYAYVNLDYTQRAEPSEVFKIAKKYYRKPKNKKKKKK
jgi:peroxiredoxin